MSKPAAHKDMDPKIVQVDIVSDIICPWCWLGSRYFQMAASQSDATLSVTWRPYMLDPTVPEGGVDYKTYMKEKFGDSPSNKFKAMREHLEAAAPDAGITFRFSDIKIRPNTLKAHRLLKWAQVEDVGSAVSEGLFKATFDTLENISDPDVLARIGFNSGMNAAGLVKRIASNEDRESVLAEIQYFRGLGVSGVPTFIYNGQFAIQGAQPVEAHLKAIKQAQDAPALSDVNEPILT